MMDEIDLQDFSLFEPKTDKETNDLRIDYPELAQENAFRDLQPRELRFVWMYANRTSPIFKQAMLTKMDKKLKAKTCAEIVFGKFNENNKVATKLANGDFDPKIRTAIERMAQYQPSFRLRARLMTEYMFDKMQTIIIATDNEIKSMGPDDRKKYTSLILDITDKLPEVINKVEQGFGIVFKKKNNDKSEIQIASVKDIIKDLD